jgi:hypothetical protein
MANPSPQQVVWRGRFERVIALAAPALDAVLSVGDRVARAVGPDDEYYPVRSGGDAFEIAGAPELPDDSALDDA